MSYILHDDDEWEPVSTYRPCTACGGDPRKCNGVCTGAASYGFKRRPPEDVARIKAERCRKEEDDILACADAIRTARGRGE